MKKKVFLPIIFLMLLSLHKAAGQPVMIKPIPTDSYNFFESLGKLYFFHQDSLWRSDGTAAGTTFVKDLGGETGISIPEEGYEINNAFFFITQSGSGFRLWRSNGTAAGTHSVAVYSDIEPLAVYNNEFYFGAMDGTTAKLFKVGSGAPVFLKSVNVFPDSPLELNDAAVVNGFLVFAAYPSGLLELWRTNGTAAGTIKIKDLPASFFYQEHLDNFTVVNNTLFFSNLTSFSLWKSDGTSAGTMAIGGNASGLVNYQGKLFYFERVDMSSAYLMSTGGTAAGTKVIWQFDLGDSFIQEAGVVNDLIYFINRERDGSGILLRSDGTAAGSYPLLYFSENTGDFTRAANHLFWNDNGTLWQSDLNRSTSMPVEDLFTGISIPNVDHLVNVNNHLFFSSLNAGTRTLWKYNPNAPAVNIPFFTVVDADSDDDQAWLQEGDTIVKNPGDLINIRFNSTLNPGSVRFVLNGSTIRTENEAPFALAGDNSGNYNAWLPSAQGNYTLTAQQYSGNGATGSLLGSVTVHFYVKVINHGQMPVANAGPDKSITLPTNQVQLTGSASDPDGSVQSVYWYFVEGSQGSEIPLIYSANSLSTMVEFWNAGVYRFRLQVTDNRGNQAYDDVLVNVTGQGGTIYSFILINADTDAEIAILGNGATLDLATLPENLNVKAAIVNGSPGSVRFQLDGIVRTENEAPFALFGDNNGNYNAGDFSYGNHTLTATAYTGNNATGTATSTYTITFFADNSAMRASSFTSASPDLRLTSYPNPSTDYFDITILIEKDGRAAMEVYDESGKQREKLFDGNVNAKDELKVRWNASGYHPGIYFVKVVTGESVYFQKLVLN